MALALRSLHDLPSLTGNIDRRYPLGDAPIIQPATLGINLVAFNAANIVLTGFNQGGAAIDFNYRQFLTGTSAATATISVSAASGFLGGWKVDASGNGISNDLTIAGSGTLFVSASDGVNPPVSFPVQSWSVQTVVQQSAIKLVTGNGFWLDNQFWTGSNGAVAQEQTNWNSLFPFFSNNALVKYFFMEYTWGAGEQVRGNYTKVFADIDAVLAKLATASTKTGLILSMWIEFFNTTNTTNTGQWPQYVINNGWIQSCIANSQGRTQLKWDIDDVWAAYGDFCVAICNRYNGHPLFWGFCPMDETDMVSQVDNVTQPVGSGLSPNQTILNSSHYVTQLQALFMRILGALPNTPAYLPFNYLPPGGSTEAPNMANMINAIEAKYPKHAIYGGPDPFVRQTTFQKLVSGLYQSTTGMGDIRKNILLMNRIQGAYLGNRNDANGNPINPGVTPLQIYDNAVTTNNCVMLTWNYETYMYYKASDEFAAIQTRNGVVGTPPAGGNYQLI